MSAYEIHIEMDEGKEAGDGIHIRIETGQYDICFELLPGHKPDILVFPHGSDRALMDSEVFGVAPRDLMNLNRIIQGLTWEPQE